MTSASAVAVPADPNQVLSVGANLDEQTLKVPFREAVGGLLYLATGTRPDIAYAISSISRFLENPKQIHWNALKRILKYVNGTTNYGMIFKSN